jgi:hypothetical protein
MHFTRATNRKKSEQARAPNPRLSFAIAIHSLWKPDVAVARPKE